MEYVALLRAINVGKRRIKMDVLKTHLETLPLENVRTHIASGNVLFDSDVDPIDLQIDIENRLLECLSYDVATFVRTKKQLNNAIKKNPFEQPENGSLFVIFHAKKMTADVRIKIADCETDDDTFHHISNELFWKCEGPSHKSKFSNAKLERLTKQSSTMRNVRTVVTLIEKFNS